MRKQSVKTVIFKPQYISESLGDYIFKNTWPTPGFLFNRSRVELKNVFLANSQVMGPHLKNNILHEDIPETFKKKK